MPIGSRSRLHLLLPLATALVGLVATSLAFGSDAQAQSTWQSSTDVTTLPNAADNGDLSGATMSGDGLLWSVDNKDRVAIAWQSESWGWSKVAAWDISWLDGTWIEDPEAIAWVAGSLAGSAGAIFLVVDEETNLVHQIRIAGSTVTIERSIDLRPWASAAGSDGIEGLAWSHDESNSSADVFYAGVENSAELLRVSVAPGSASPAVTSVRLPIPEIAGLADDPNGDAIYVISESDKTVYVTTTTGAAPSPAFVASSMEQPEGIVFDHTTSTIHLIGEGAQEHASWQPITPTPPSTPAPTDPPATPPPGSGSAESGTVSVRIDRSSDDAEQLAGGAMYLDSSDLELTWDRGGHQTVGLRFASVPVPAGATITSAHIEFTIDEKNSGATQLSIAGEATGSAATYSWASGDLDRRARTAAFVNWSPAAWDTWNTTYQTPDLSGIVQEIVSRDDWATGAPIAFIVSGSGERTADSYDGAPNDAPVLHIEWHSETPVATPTPTPTPPPATPTPTPPPATPTPTPTPTPPPATPTPTLDVEPSTAVFALTSGADDVEVRWDGSHNVGSGDLDVARTDRPIGLRYHVCIDAGAVILDARLTVVADEADSRSTSATVRIERSGDAAPFAAQRVTDRTLHPMTVAWNDWSTWSPGTVEVSPDLSGLIATVTADPSWTGCGHVVLVLAGTGDREAVSYETDPSTAPTLTITTG